MTRGLIILLCLAAPTIAAAATAVVQEHAPPQQHAPVGEQEPHGEAPRTGGAGDEHGSDAPHDSPWTLVARLVNFALLAGTLVYFLRSPLAAYLRDRSRQVQRDLKTAEETRAAAARQIEEIDRRLEALPGEINTLRTRGAEEIAAEETRIQQLAQAERERLLEQTRREIDLQLRIARRELIEEAANLAVGVASERIKHVVTTDDQLRLVDRFVEQVRRK